MAKSSFALTVVLSDVSYFEKTAVFRQLGDEGRVSVRLPTSTVVAELSQLGKKLGRSFTVRIDEDEDPYGRAAP